MLMKNSNGRYLKYGGAFLYYKIFLHNFFGHVHMRTKIFRSCAHVHTGGEHKKA